MSVTVINKMPLFTKMLAVAMDDAIREAARDTYIKAKSTAPFQKGQLRGDSDFHRIAPAHQRVAFYKEYAGYQEFGQRKDGSHIVRRYTTPGTGAHFLKNAGDSQRDKLRLTIKKHAARVRV